MAPAVFPVAIRFRLCFFLSLGQEGATSRPRALNSENLVPDCRTVWTSIPRSASALQQCRSIDGRFVHYE
jgi:hypothetical protein